VGKVVGVSNYRVTVLLDPEIRSQVRAFPHHITLITQIGGYLLFPVAPGEAAVGIVVGAFEDEAIEPDVDRAMTLQLTRARRTLRVNLLGQLVESRPFETGISIYPALETPALLPTEDELRHILEYEPPPETREKDLSLLIGTSPIYARQPVKASFNDLLSRPFGIIGNTGSGKSCSVASIIQTALAAEESTAKQAKFIILDINGEYSEAFPTEAGGGAAKTRELNTAYVDGKEFALPLWAFNLNEMISFFEASQASQVPVLERVITAAREQSIDTTEEARKVRTLSGLAGDCSQYLDDLSSYVKAPESAGAGDKTRHMLDHIQVAMEKIGQITDTVVPIPNIVGEFSQCVLEIPKVGITTHHVPPETVAAITAIVEDVRAAVEEIRNATITAGGLQPITADSPVAFPPDVLLGNALFHQVISRFRGQERMQEYIATLRLRIHRQLSDKRWSVFTEETGSTFEEVLAGLTGGTDSRIVVVDCSLLAHDVLPFFCAIFGRLLLEMREHAEPSQRTVQPYVIVLEEAHNYLKPRKEDESSGLRLAREAFERIAKEGRKFGLSLLIASQRPSDVSATVLSQCANFLVHRIQNPEDIDYFKKILPTGSRDLLDQLPIFAPGDGILLGSALNVPARLKVRLPYPKPKSDTPQPWDAWKVGRPLFNLEESCTKWVVELGGEGGDEATTDDNEDEIPF
jgi:hypothetical protein